MPAEIRQRIIEHLLPNIAGDAMEICPCLSKAPKRAKRSCSCYKNGLSWDDAYRRPPANIALLHRPTLLVNRLLHADTVHVLAKLPPTIHFCSGPCLLAFMRCNPYKHRKLINLGVLKFHVHQFWKYEFGTGNYKALKLLHCEELEKGFANQLGYMLRARSLWGLPSDPDWSFRPCLRFIRDHDENLQHLTLGLKLDVGKELWVLYGDQDLQTEGALGFGMNMTTLVDFKFKDWWLHGNYEPVLRIPACSRTLTRRR